MTYYVNPDLAAFQKKNPIVLSVDQKTCNFHIFVGPWSKFSECDRAKDFLTKSGLSFEEQNVAGKAPSMKVGNATADWDSAATPAVNQGKWLETLKGAGYPTAADKSKINWFMAEVILFIMLIYVTMVYGPIAAFLVELFPTKIRYTSMSLPYHIGNGWFGGMLPLLATAMVAASGNIYYGLWYPIAVAAMTLIVGTAFLRETKDHKVRVDL